MSEEEVLKKLGFKYNEEKKYWHKAIIPGGDRRGKRYVLYYRDGEFWTFPAMKKENVEYLGEVLLFRKHMEGKINVFETNLDEPVPVTINGTKYFAELSMTPEEADSPVTAVKEEEKKKENKIDHYEMVLKITGYDIFEIFSDSGTGKSKIALEIARNAVKNNHRVFYYDTEGNITEEEAEFFGKNYEYSPAINDLLNFKFPDVDLLIIDSVTYPFWIKFASMNMKERGEALLKLHAYLGKLKEWCVKTKRLAIVISQPISELREDRRPWGGKAFHIAKEIVKPELVSSAPNETVINIVAYRMRRFGRGAIIANVVINDRGVDIRWRI